MVFNPDKRGEEIARRGLASRERAKKAAEIRRAHYAIDDERKAQLQEQYGTYRICDCENCNMNCNMGSDGYSLEAKYPCGQYRCWLSIERWH